MEMVRNITDETKTMIESELRKGTSNSRIANLLGVSYEQALEVVKPSRNLYDLKSVTK